MIKRTFERAIKSKKLNDLIIATDSQKILNFCKENSIPAILTGHANTGTDRVALIAQKIDADLYVNIQGDEPVIDFRSIDEVIALANDEKYAAFNLYKNIDENEAQKSSIVKVITNEKDELLYMSRFAVPFNKSGLDLNYKKQVAVYAFKKWALEAFYGREKTLNEKFEDIEILRFLDLGFKVKMGQTKYSSIGVDFPEDILAVEDFLKKHGLK